MKDSKLWESKHSETVLLNLILFVNTLISWSSWDQQGNQIPCCFLQVNIWIIVWAPLWDSAPNLSLFIFEALHGIESSQLPGTSTLYISKATPSDPSFCARCSKHPSWVQGKESQWELWRDHLMMTTSLLRRNFKFVPADTGLPIPSTRFI
jgi:hypothetical protein